MVPWDMLYAEDLVISAEMESQSIEKFNTWNKTLQKRGLKISVDKTSIWFQAKNLFVKKIGKYPCACCLKGVGANSIRCNSCNHTVKEFCYLGDIIFRWKWRNTCIIRQNTSFLNEMAKIVPLLLNKVELSTRCHIYGACLRPVLMYCWNLGADQGNIQLLKVLI